METKLLSDPKNHRGIRDSGPTIHKQNYAGFAMTMSDVQETIKIKACNNNSQFAVLILLELL